MSGTWPLVLPLALGAAVSPTLLMLQLFILTGRAHRVSRAWAYTLGVTVTSVAFVALVATVARGLTLGSSDQSLTERIVKLAVAAGLLLLGIRALRRRDDSSDQPARRRLGLGPESSWWDFVAVGLGAMALNVSSLALMLAGVHVSVTGGTDVPAQLGLITLCAVAPALLPALAATALGSRSDRILGRLSAFTDAHAAVINAGICFLFTVLLVISAVRS